MPPSSEDIPQSFCGKAQWRTAANLNLIESVSSGDLDGTTRAIVQQGANPCFFDGSQEGSPSTLHALSNAKDTDDLARCAKVLLTHGATDVINTTLISNLNTPLHLAAAMGREKLCQVLLAARGSPHSQNAFGNTPLHSAVHSGSAAIVKLLLESGTDPNAPNHRGSTALHIAAFLAKEDTTPKGNKSDPCVDISSLLVTQGKVDVNAADINGYTALHIAAQRGCNDLISVLVTEGKADLAIRTNIDSKGRGGRTPRQMAEFGGKAETAALIERMEAISASLGAAPMRRIVECLETDLAK